MRSKSRFLMMTMVLVAVAAGRGAAQRPPKPAVPPHGAVTQPRYHGILEPVSYSQDVSLNDVLFVTPEEGWVTGGEGTHSGVLLHTRDAGSTWTVALGDASGSERSFYHLRFLDRTTGFVAQGTAGGDHKLLRTTDGSTWRVTGTVPQHHQDYQFMSPTAGVAAASASIVRTTDAGRTWTKVFDCQVQVQVRGVNVRSACEVSSFSFPSATIGFALAGSLDTKGLYVFKTEDAGATWTTAVALPGANDGRQGHIFFTNDRTGFACLANGTLLATGDGAATWDEIPGASCPEKASVLFADPEVGWAALYNYIAWTGDGGRRWTKQQIRPAYALRAFSFPRRDRAFLVGDHGEIYRYSIVPAGVKMNALDAPLMPGFSTALEDRVAELERNIAGVDSALAALPANSSPPAPFLDKCCGTRLSSLDLAFKGVAELVPSYTGAYRNLNLRTLGLHVAGSLPERTNNVRDGIATLRSATDKASAQQALANVKTAAAALHAAADTAVQKTTP